MKQLAVIVLSDSLWPRNQLLQLRPATFVIRSRLFFLLFFLYWNIIALPCCVSLCSTMKWISCMYTYNPSLLDSSSHPTHLGHHRALSWSPCDLQQVSTILHMAVYICQSQSPNSSHSPLPPPVSTHLFSLCLHLCSCPENRSICTIFLDSTYTS